MPRPTSTSSSSSPPDPRHPMPSGFRPDIQALRALAVSAVLLYHLWPGLVPGGYVGVDVFFVVSGFLITGLLVRELEATGRVDLLAFYAGRVRRLLPAALLVLGRLAGVLVVFMPPVVWRSNVAEIAAAAVYGLNWALGLQQVDYFTESDASQPGPALLVAEPRGAVLPGLAASCCCSRSGSVRWPAGAPSAAVRWAAVTAIGLLSLVMCLSQPSGSACRLLQHPGARLGVRPGRTGRPGAGDAHRPAHVPGAGSGGRGRRRLVVPDHVREARRFPVG